MAPTTTRPRIERAGSIEVTDLPLKLGIYGDNGSGKTHFLADLDERDLIIACEPGILTAVKEATKAGIIRCFDWPSFQYTIDQAAKGAFDKYRCIGIDGFQAAQENLMRWLTGTAAATNSNRDPDQPAVQDYGIAQNRFRRYMSIINTLPQHVIYTLTSMDSEDEEGESIVLPNLSGKNGTKDPTNMSKVFMSNLHAYAYLKVVRKKVETDDDDDEETGGKVKYRDMRRLIFKRSGPYFGKDRYGVLGPQIDDPTVGEIFRRIESLRSTTTTHTKKKG